MMTQNTITSLCKLGYKYGTDKCPQIKHAYTPFYFELLHSKQKSIKKLLELGIGSTRRNNHQPEVIYEDGIKKSLENGASLYMWRDFFPNAQIFGADNRQETLFEAGRIKTYLCDETKEADLISLIKNIGPDIDIVIDDASHHVHDQIFACQTLMPLLKKDAIYIIEDVSHSKLICKAMGTIGDYQFNIPPIPRTWHGGMVVVITASPH